MFSKRRKSFPARFGHKNKPNREFSVLIKIRDLSKIDTNLLIVGVKIKFILYWKLIPILFYFIINRALGAPCRNGDQCPVNAFFLATNALLSLFTERNHRFFRFFFLENVPFVWIFINTCFLHFLDYKGVLWIFVFSILLIS